jgi:hypothetical protein
MKTLVLSIALLAAGCVSAPPGSRAGWNVSLVSIQLGGTCNTVDTQNYMAGTNVVQTHTLPITSDQKADTSLSYPGKP